MPRVSPLWEFKLPRARTLVAITGRLKMTGVWTVCIFIPKHIACASHKEDFQNDVMTLLVWVIIYHKLGLSSTALGVFVFELGWFYLF